MLLLHTAAAGSTATFEITGVSSLLSDDRWQPAAIDLEVLERRDACMREISPSPLTSKASSVGSH